MQEIAKTLRHCIKVCKSVHKSRKKLTLFRYRGKLFSNKIYRGYYTNRVICNLKKFRNRLLFSTLSIATAIVQPTEEQKRAFIRQLRATHAQCFTNPTKKTEDNEFEKCKVCKDHFKSYLQPMRDDIMEGCHLREDVVLYIARYCGIDEARAIDFLLSIGKEQDLVQEICKWMSPCTLSDKTNAYPNEKQKNEFNYKLKTVPKYERCVYCKRKFSQRLNTSAPKPFIINNNVKKETKDFTNIDEDWLWGKENKREYIERVCGVMGACDD